MQGVPTHFVFCKKIAANFSNNFKSKLIRISTKEKLENGLACASAGNHAQGFAYSCNKLNLNGTILVGMELIQGQ